ncbi:MAG: IclR family transcriptional regulator [Ramlibacter sp.]|nr:IclR family transcriptional regulator [Ramlibacter sp.]
MKRGIPATEGPEAHDGAQSVRRALAVLRLVASGQERGVRMVDIATMSGLSRPTVHRLLKVLIDETAVEQDPLTRRYLVGTELSLLGLARSGRFPIRAIAGPYLQALADEVGDTVFLSVCHGADSVCIARYVGSYPIQVLSIDVGVRRPLGASVSGIVLLSGMNAAKARALTDANLPRLVAAKRDVQAMLGDIEAARQQGHIYAATGVMPGTSAAAVPIRDADGKVLAAISITALSDRLDRKRLPTVLAQAKAQAQAITQRHTEVALHAARRSS